MLIIAQTLKALDFLLKKSVLATVVFYTQKKTQGRGSIHRFNKSFPLKPSLGLNSSNFMQCEIQTQIDELLSLLGNFKRQPGSICIIRQCFN